MATELELPTRASAGRAAKVPEEVSLLIKVAIFKIMLALWALSSLLTQALSQAITVIAAVVLILLASKTVVAGLARRAQAAARQREKAEAEAKAAAVLAAAIAAKKERARKFEEAKSESAKKFFSTVGQRDM